MCNFRGAGVLRWNPMRLALLPFLILLLAAGARAEPATRPSTLPAADVEANADADVEANVASFDFVWETVGRRYYDPDMQGVDWQAARDRLRPKVAAAGSREEAREHIQELLDLLGESHLAVLPAEGYDALQAVTDAGESTTRPDEDEDEDEDEDGGTAGETGLRVRVTDLDGGPAVVIVDVTPDTPAAEAGITPGTVVVAVNGKPLGGLLADVQESMPERYRDGPNRPFLLNEAAGAAVDGGTDSRGTTVTLTLDDGRTEPRDVELERAEPAGVVTQLGNLPPTAIRIDTRRVEGGGATAQYATFSNFLDPVRVMSRLRDATREAREGAEIDGFVLDLRGNTGGLIGMGTGVAGLFVGEPGHTLGTMTQREMTLKNVIFPQKGGLGKPLAVLIDHSSVSMSEILAGGLQELGRAGVIEARVFGRRTAGMALPSEMGRLPNGDGIIFVIADHTLPSGARLEGVGVEPDETVPLDDDAVAALRRGEDPALGAALGWIATRRDAAPATRPSTNPAAD